MLGNNATNYNLDANTVTTTVKIGKIDYTGTNTASDTVFAKQVTTGKTLALPDLPDGASYAAAGTAGGDTAALISSNSVSGTTLTYSTTAQSAGTSATITIPATGATNYNDYDVTVTITTVDKADAGVAIECDDPTATYGDTGITLSATVSNPGTEGTGTLTWSSSDEDVVTIDANGALTIKNAGFATITASYESDTTMGADEIEFNVTPKFIEKPTAATGLQYTGEALELITETTDGMLYAVTTENSEPDAAAFSSGMPEGTDAGTYYVWYMAAGDENHNPSKASQIAVEIAEPDPVPVTVTFKVVNGAWDDDQMKTDRTVTLGEDGILDVDDVPDVGDSPDDGYKAGGWDTEPPLETAITEDATYTYTYADQTAATVLKAPTAKELTGNGGEQELVEAGEAENGTMVYALGDADGPTGEYSSSIPTGKEPGTYTVWYKAAGDDGYTDSAAGKVTVTIAEPEPQPISVTVTLKVVHGQWGDELGGSEDRTIFLEGSFEEELRLKFEQIPDVNKPDEGYTAETGSWGQEPPFVMDGQAYGEPITEDTVYTYTYGLKEEASVTKEPKKTIWICSASGICDIMTFKIRHNQEPVCFYRF